MVARTTTSLKLALLGALVLGAGAGCSRYKLEPPEGFVEVHAYSSEARMKARDNVGLNLRVFRNVRGGSLGYWASDLVEKLSLRGYALVGQEAARSGNGVVGTRLDFDYTPPNSDTPKFFTAVIFVTDEYKFVLQFAGDKVHFPKYRGRVDEIVGDLKVRGCKPFSKICKGPQPERFAIAPPSPSLAAEGKDVPAAAEAASPDASGASTPSAANTAAAEESPPAEAKTAASGG
jgi:hypothetical protein